MLYNVGYLVHFDAWTHEGHSVVVADSSEAVLRTGHHKRPQETHVERYHLMRCFQHDNVKRVWGLVVEQ